MTAQLQRLVLDYRGEAREPELVVRCLYRTEDGAGPSTKKRRREVEDLVRDGLERALEELRGGDVDVVGTSGFVRREDILSITTNYSLQGTLEQGTLRRGA